MAEEDDKDKTVSKEEFQKLQEQLNGTISELDSLKSKNKELLDEKKKAAKQAEDAIAEAAKKNGDVEALEKSWQQKLDEQEQSYKGRVTELESHVNELTVGATATKLASELAVPGSADVLMPHIRSRLTVEVKDGKPITRVLGADGKASAMSVDELKTEIQKNEGFAPILQGSKASGTGHKGTGGAGGGQVQYRDRMTPAEKNDYLKEHGQQAYLQLPKAPPQQQ